MSIGGPTRLAAWSCPAGGEWHSAVPLRWMEVPCEINPLSHSSGQLGSVNCLNLQCVVPFLVLRTSPLAATAKRQTVISPPSLFLSFASSLFFFFLFGCFYVLRFYYLSFLPRHIGSNPRKEKARFPQTRTHDPFLVQYQTPTSNPASWLHETRQHTTPTRLDRHTHENAEQPRRHVRWRALQASHRRLSPARWAPGRRRRHGPAAWLGRHRLLCRLPLLLPPLHLCE